MLHLECNKRKIIQPQTIKEHMKLIQAEQTHLPEDKGFKTSSSGPQSNDKDRALQALTWRRTRRKASRWSWRPQRWCWRWSKRGWSWHGRRLNLSWRNRLRGWLLLLLGSLGGCRWCSLRVRFFCTLLLGCLFTIWILIVIIIILFRILFYLFATLRNFLACRERIRDVLVEARSLKTYRNQKHRAGWHFRKGRLFSLKLRIPLAVYKESLFNKIIQWWKNIQKIQCPNPFGHSPHTHHDNVLQTFKLKQLWATILHKALHLHEGQLKLIELKGTKISLQDTTS